MTHKILIVDDDDGIHQVIKRIFKQSPYELISAYDGAQVEEKIQASGVPDLVLLDVQMPEKNGYDTLRELRSNSATHSIPVLMLTGLGEVVDKAVGFELGADDYVAKPFDAKSLRKHVTTIIEES